MFARHSIHRPGTDIGKKCQAMQAIIKVKREVAHYKLMTHKRVCVGIRSCLQKQLCTLSAASKTSIMKGCPSILHTQCPNNGDNDQMIQTWTFKYKSPLSGSCLSFKASYHNSCAMKDDCQTFKSLDRHWHWWTVTDNASHQQKKWRSACVQIIRGGCLRPGMGMVFACS